MRGRGGGPGRALASGSLAVCLVGAGAHASATGRSPAARANAPHPALEDRVPELRSARLRARDRLGSPGCQAVLADFAAVNGQRLDEVLRASGRTAQQQLDLLVFESGLGRPPCDRRVSLAFTQVHSPVVSICLQPFTLLRRAEQDAVLIHEMLHSLGLGENPPESVAISAQVLKRCGH